MNHVRAILILLAFFGLSMSSAYATTYIITKNVSNQFVVAIEDGGTLGSPSASIQIKINEIKVSAKGKPCTIQFGNGINTLDIDMFNIVFNGGTSGVEWGLITLTGKLTSEVPNAAIDPGLIYLTNGASISSEADITNTANVGQNIFNVSTGTVTISGGTIKSSGVAGSSAVFNLSTGVINITGGTVSAEGGYAIINNSTGQINISSGTVSTTTGIAIYSHYTGTGAITISGGTVSATNGRAVENACGTLTINGGILFAYGTAITDVIDGEYTQSGNAVIVAWNEEEGTNTYTAGASDDIFKLPATATAVWAKKGGNGGIAVANGENTGFIPIAGVTIEVGISEISSEQIQVYPNPTTGGLRIENGELRIENVEVFDVFGRKQKAESRKQKAEGTVLMDISELTVGIYFVKITTDAGEVVRKVVKN